MADQLEQRVAALERAVTDDEGDPAALADAAVTAERLEDLEATVADLEDRVAELEAATQALRGYVGNVRSVNREVEQRADLALSRVEALDGEESADGHSRHGEPVAPGSGTEAGPELDGESGPEPNPGAGPEPQRDTHADTRRCASCGRPADIGTGEPERPATPDRQGPAPDGSTVPSGTLGATGLRERDSGEEDTPDGPVERLRALL